MAGVLLGFYDKLAAIVAAWALELAILKGLARLTIWKIIYLFAFQFPSLKHRLVDDMNKENQMDETALSVDQWVDTIVTLRAWRSSCKSFILDMRKQAKQGGPVLSALLVDLDRQMADIADYQRPGRPLAIFFGSCS
jgi:hypothetical protein